MSHKIKDLNFLWVQRHMPMNTPLTMADFRKSGIGMELTDRQLRYTLQGFEALNLATSNLRSGTNQIEWTRTGDFKPAQLEYKRSSYEYIAAQLETV